MTQNGMVAKFLMLLETLGIIEAEVINMSHISAMYMQGVKPYTFLLDSPLQMSVSRVTYLPKV